METIIFVKNAVHWTENADYNLSFVKARGEFLKKLFTIRGYIYLNQIYEHLGVGWNPENINELYLLDDGPIEFKFKPTDENSIVIHIKQ